MTDEPKAPRRRPLALQGILRGGELVACYEDTPWPTSAESAEPAAPMLSRDGAERRPDSETRSPGLETRCCRSPGGSQPYKFPAEQSRDSK